MLEGPNLFSQGPEILVMQLVTGRCNCLYKLHKRSWSYIINTSVCSEILLCQGNCVLTPWVLNIVNTPEQPRLTSFLNLKWGQSLSFFHFNNHSLNFLPGRALTGLYCSRLRLLLVCGPFCCQFCFQKCYDLVLIGPRRPGVWTELKLSRQNPIEENNRKDKRNQETNQLSTGVQR